MDRDVSNTEDKWEVHIGDKIKEPDYTFFMEGTGTCPRGDIIAIKAKSKNGKTFLATVFASAILGSGFASTKAANSDTSSVLFFDTEQNRANTWKILNRIITLCEGCKDIGGRVRAYSLREMDVSERLSFVERVSQEHSPTAVFVDGIADTIPDFNDIEQSQEAIQRMMAMSARLHCAVIFILHTNKADNNMKGHLGTLATQKCSDVFSVERTGDIFAVTETECRNMPIPDFFFALTEDGIPMSAEGKIKESRTLDEGEAIIRFIFSTIARSDTMSNANLVQEYMAIEGGSKRAAYNAIKKAAEKGIISRDEKGTVRILQP